jgi:hypothetical protein
VAAEQTARGAEMVIFNSGGNPASSNGAQFASTVSSAARGRKTSHGLCDGPSCPLLREEMETIQLNEIQLQQSQRRVHVSLAVNSFSETQLVEIT